MVSKFFERFKRVTNGGTYMPEIDGLRFIALAMVVMLIHMGTYTHGHVLHIQTVGLVYRLCLLGGDGVSLFFIISGFILSLPFAKQHLFDAPKISFKNYYLRRIIRIEPAYIISLIIYFCLRIWVMHYETFKELFPHFLASLFYVHNIIYKHFSAVNSVSWSLEVEVQFYLLAPFVCYIFCLKNRIIRRLLIVAIIFASICFSLHWAFHIGSILDKSCFFATGMLLADFYLLRKKDFNKPIYLIIGIACFIFFAVTPAFFVGYWFWSFWFLFTSIFFFLAITNTTLIKWLSYKPVTLIGGMCYSIYLVHQGVLGSLRHHFALIQFSNITWVNGTIHYVAALIMILIVSGVFFLLIEKPTMKRDWHKKLFSKKKNVFIVSKVGNVLP